MWQLVPLVRPGHRKTAPTESVSVGARHDQVAVVSRAKSRSMRICQISPNFPYMLHVPVARSCSDDSAIRYVGLLPFLWMTSSFHIMEPMGQNQADRYAVSSSARRRLRGQSLPSPTALPLVGCFRCPSINKVQRPETNQAGHWTTHVVGQPTGVRPGSDQLRPVTADTGLQRRHQRLERLAVGAANFHL